MAHDVKFRLLINDALFEENERKGAEDIKACTDFLHNGDNTFTIEVTETMSTSKKAGIKFDVLVKGKKKFHMELFPNKDNKATSVSGVFAFTKLPGPSSKKMNKKKEKLERQATQRAKAKASKLT